MRCALALHGVAHRLKHFFRNKIFKINPLCGDFYHTVW